MQREIFFIERATAPAIFARLPGLPELFLGLQGGHLGAGIGIATFTTAAEAAAIAPAAVDKRALLC